MLSFVKVRIPTLNFSFFGMFTLQTKKFHNTLKTNSYLYGKTLGLIKKRQVGYKEFFCR